MQAVTAALSMTEQTNKKEIIMLKFVTTFNMIIVILMTAAYFYQFIYTATGLICRRARTGSQEAPSFRGAHLRTK